MLNEEEVAAIKMGYTGENPAEIQQLIDWASEVRTRQGLLDSLCNGHVRVHMRDGEPAFALSDEGKEHIEGVIEGRGNPAMMDRARELRQDAARDGSGVDRPSKDFATEQMLEAASDFITAHGGNPVVVGGIDVERLPNDERRFKLVVQCTGKPPVSRRNDGK